MHSLGKNNSKNVWKLSRVTCQQINLKVWDKLWRKDDKKINCWTWNHIQFHQGIQKKKKKKKNSSECWASLGWVILHSVRMSQQSYVIVPSLRDTTLKTKKKKIIIIMFCLKALQGFKNGCGMRFPPLFSDLLRSLQFVCIAKKGAENWLGSRNKTMLLSDRTGHDNLHFGFSYL